MHLLLPQLLSQIALFKLVSPSVISAVYLGLWVREDFILTKFFHWEILSSFMATSVFKYMTTITTATTSITTTTTTISCA